MNRLRSYFGRHWRGELSLGVSYWLGALTANVLSTAASLPLLYLLTEARVETAFAWYYAWTWAATIAASTWSLVGVWRSARRRLVSGPDYWAQLAKYVVILNAACLTALFFTTGVASIREGLKFSTTLEGFAGEVRVLPGGDGMELAGGIGFGFADKVIRALDANPGVKTIQTNLYKGGLIGEAAKLSAEITRRGLATNVSGACVSACAYVYLGGVKRTVSSQARIGLHRPFVPGGSAFGEFVLGSNEVKFMTSRGVDRAFAERAMRTGPTEMWYPGLGDLVASKFADRVASPSEAGSAGPPLESDRRQTDDELQKLRLYRALKRGDLPTYERIVGLVALATATGKPVPEVARELMPETSAAFIREIPFADDASLSKLAQVYAEEFRAMQAISPRACWAAATGAAGAAGDDSWNKLPAGIQEKSTDSMADVFETARESRPSDSPRAAALTLAKVRANVASRLRQDETTEAGSPEENEQKRTCEKLILVWDEFARLPAPQAGAAIRTFFRNHQAPASSTGAGR